MKVFLNRCILSLTIFEFLNHLGSYNQCFCSGLEKLVTLFSKSSILHIGFFKTKCFSHFVFDVYFQNWNFCLIFSLHMKLICDTSDLLKDRKVHGDKNWLVISWFSIRQLLLTQVQDFYMRTVLFVHYMSQEWEFSENPRFQSFKMY